MNQLFTEGVDAVDSINTAYRIDVGDSFRGTISTSADEDWIAVTLTAGETYQIDMTGDSTVGGLSDPYLRLYDANGFFIGGNDDFNGLDSQITFTATTTGTYFIEADAYSTRTGTYLVEIEAVATPDPSGEATLDELALFLTEGYWGDERTFDLSSSNVITVNLTGLTSEGRQLARWAMEAWEAVVDIDFVEVSTDEMLTFDDESSGAYAYWPGGTGSDGVEVNVSRDWLVQSGTSIDTYSFQTYVHEIGHAIGLGHQGDYNGFATYGRDETFANDSWQVSVMSYFSQTDNTLINASYGYTAGPMMADILAIQNLYGAPGTDTATAGDTVYGLNSDLGNYMDEVFAWLATGTSSANVTGNPMVFTLYDRSGTDLLDLSYLEVAARLDMRAEQFSDFGTQIGVLGIARGTVLENALTGSGDDIITGNEADNVIEGNAGEDTIRGGTGNDTVLGGAGRDSLLGNSGSDSLYGGAGFDTLSGGGSDDTLLGDEGADSLYGDVGNDRLEGGQGFDQLFGGSGNDTLFAGETADRVYGGDGDDFISGGSNFGTTVDGLFGEAGNDTIYGDGGFDLLDGGEGDDYLDGGDQADNLYGDLGNDTLLGGTGLDRLFAGAGDDRLDGGTGNDGLFGEAGNDTMIGGAGDDNFFGGSGNDTIAGGGGNDTINGGSGFDTIVGGTGDDMMFGRFNADIFVFADGHGNDTIGDFAAGNRFERVDLSSVSAITDLSDLQLGNASGGAARQVGNDVVIDTGTGSSILMVDVNLSDLDATDFIF